MAKSVKSVVREMNKKLTRREASRKAQNERRKAERRLAREIEAETGQKVARKQAVEMFEAGYGQTKQAESLYNMIKSLQARKTGGYDVELSKIEESISAYTRIRYGTETLGKKGDDITLERRNKMFERQINQSTARNGLSTLSEEKSRAFYAGTKDIWDTSSKSDNYNATIMLKFGLNDLEQVYKLLTNDQLKPEDFGFTDKDAFDEWIDEIDKRTNLLIRREKIKEHLDSIGKSSQTGGDTNDSQYNGSDVKDKETSPEYLNRIISSIAAALNNV